MRARLVFAALILLTAVNLASAADAVKIAGWSLDGSPVYVHFRDATSAAPQFNKALSDNRKRGEIVACTAFAEFPLGKIETVYAGSCTLKETHRSTEVQICYDTGVGEFGLAPRRDGLDPNTSLIQFTFDHCGGG